MPKKQRGDNAASKGGHPAVGLTPWVHTSAPKSAQGSRAASMYRMPEVALTPWVHAHAPKSARGSRRGTELQAWSGSEKWVSTLGCALLRPRVPEITQRGQSCNHGVAPSRRPYPLGTSGCAQDCPRQQNGRMATITNWQLAMGLTPLVHIAAPKSARVSRRGTELQACAGARSRSYPLGAC